MIKWIFVVLGVSTCALHAALAPDSISGTVFRDRGGIAALRVVWEHTIVFGDDGRYTFVKAASASTLDGNWRIEAPPENGNYSYVKTGEYTGVVTFSGSSVNRVYWRPVEEPLPSEGPIRFTLDFAIPSSLGGEWGGEFVHSLGARGTFSITRVSSLRREPLPNISMRGAVSADRPLIVGFVLNGDARDVLIRVIGPSLRTFGVSQFWRNPRFDIFRSGSASPIGGGPGPRRDAIAYYDDWTSDSFAVEGLRKLFAHAGAFPLEDGSRDAVGVTPRFTPGAYTVVCVPVGSDVGGEALVEVYVLP
jgi:hypothetical protein